MRYANEPFDYYKIHSYEFEKNLCMIFDKLDQNHIDQITYGSLLNISNPYQWDANNKIINHYDNKKKQSHFLLRLNISSKPKISNNYKESLLNKKIENIVNTALFANINGQISALSANFANTISPLKIYYSVHHLAIMSAIGLFNAPKDMIKNYEINELNKEFCEIILKNLPYNNQITWSSEIGKWLIKNFNQNIDTFFDKDNWINS